jgi:hypothetical protein
MKKTKQTQSDFRQSKEARNAWEYKDKQGELMLATKQFLNK